MNYVGKPWCDELAKVMVLARQMKRMGLREHARALKMNPATLHRIEKGKGCDVDTLLHLQEQTGIEYSVLLGGTPQRGKR